MINIRKAEAADVPAMMALVRELALYEKAPDEVSNTEERMLEEGFGPKKAFECILVELNNKIVGMSLYYFRYSTWKGPVLYLEDLIVTESFRGKGIGKALFEICIQHARAKQYRKMVWQVLDWNTPAIEFYKGYGAHMDPEWLNASIDF